MILTSDFMVDQQIAAPYNAHMNISLNLQHWIVLDVEDGAGGYEITARYDAGTMTCSSCLHTDVLYRFGMRNLAICDVPIDGKRVHVQMERQRYRCTNCGHTMMQVLPDVDHRRHMTNRLITYIQEACLRRTFVAVAAECGLDEKSVRTVFREYVQQIDATSLIETPVWLGISDVILLRRPRCIFMNLEQHRIIGVLQDRSEASVAHYLGQLRSPEQIAVVDVDMWGPYRDAVHSVLPHAKIIVSRNHVVDLADRAIEAVRRRIQKTLPDHSRQELAHNRSVLRRHRAELTPQDQKTLELWERDIPVLARAYELKERFSHIWSLSERVDAERAYEVWRETLPSDLESAFESVMAAERAWHEEIFASFSMLVADSADDSAEALRSVEKLAQASGRGYSFEVVRARVLYGMGLAVGGSEKQ